MDLIKKEDFLNLSEDELDVSVNKELQTQICYLEEQNRITKSGETPKSYGVLATSREIETIKASIDFIVSDVLKKIWRIMELPDSYCPVVRL